VGDIWYKRCVANAVEHLSFVFVGPESHAIFMGINVIELAHVP
jgi:hypothetical protein